MTRQTRIVILISVASMLGGCSRSRATHEGIDPEAALKAAVEGATLVGNMRGKDHDAMSQGERFVIERVSKVAGDTWLFQMRFQYGTHDVPVPVPIVVRWAGDTPVLMLTDVPIPGYGTYSARVVIYADQYAGMWRSAKGGGGQVFGKVLRKR